MERLTDKYRNLCISCELSIDDECDLLNQGKFCANAKRYHRLAQIEDILGDDYDLGRLKELIEADRDGRCVVLLSNDDVYTVRGDIVNGIIKANCRDACKPPKSALKGDQHG